MKHALDFGPMKMFGACLFVFAAMAGASHGETSKNSVTARTVTVDGVQLHYLTAGHGPAVILLHGYAETSRMWRPLIPRLAEKFEVIAPDLPGIGDSSIPASGIDMITSAERIHALVHSLGVEKARVVGHGYRADGGLRLRGQISLGNREARGDGRVSARRRGLGTDLQ